MYQNIDKGSAETCLCDDCKNFITNRESTYPSEIKTLFSELGIDYNKETEVYHIMSLDNNSHLYGGWFHFKGIVQNGAVPDKVERMKSVSITDKFEIGFIKGKSLNYFSKNEEDNLIQVEFTVKIE